MELPRRNHPIWEILKSQGRSIKWLAKKIGYSYAHTKNVKAHVWPTTNQFRRRCSEALDISESVLFLPIDEERTWVEQRREARRERAGA